VAVFKCQTFKQIGTGRPWSNVWHFIASDLEAAASVAEAITNSEAGILSPAVTITKRIVREVGGGPDFVSVALAVAGTLTGSGDLWPLFNTIRVIVTVAGFGRNDGKFLRGLIGDAITAGSVINGDTVTFVRNHLIDLLDTMTGTGTPLCADDGALWDAIDVSPIVQMRQEHRKRRRSA
jgi:hypothetical protein